MPFNTTSVSTTLMIAIILFFFSHAVYTIFILLISKTVLVASLLAPSYQITFPQFRYLPAPSHQIILSHPLYNISHHSNSSFHYFRFLDYSFSFSFNIVTCRAIQKENSDLSAFCIQRTFLVYLDIFQLQDLIFHLKKNLI